MDILRGTQLRDTKDFSPTVRNGCKGCEDPTCVRGFLILIPFKKNKQATPTWIPVAEKNAISIMATHLRFLASLKPSSKHMFLARDHVSYVDGRPVYRPITRQGSFMSTAAFRAMIRMALHQCCGLSESQAAQYGTHSLKIGAVELLRSRGVGQELRQQLGGWMSSAVALKYLQLTPSIQFDILMSI